MKSILSLAVCLILFSFTGISQTISFDKNTEGRPPKGFTTALTGKGKLGVWVVMKDESAPSQPNVLAQTDIDATGYRFPVCVYDSISATDVDVSVKFKPVKGSGDQAEML